ncbi:MAG TPA: hypothetical protein VMM76_09720 [Pirellulaceae bacterium]|nr:hypothetical protein [Pirellulaceae bacterium]
MTESGGMVAMTESGFESEIGLARDEFVASLSEQANLKVYA